MAAVIYNRADRLHIHMRYLRVLTQRYVMLTVCLMGVVVLAMGTCLYVRTRVLREVQHVLRCKALTMLYTALLDDVCEREMFVPTFTTAPDGTPLHSWRVLLLPSLGYDRIYYHVVLDAAWNAAENRLALASMPECFAFPRKTHCDSTTGYVAVIGPNGPWGKSLAEFRRIKEETPNAILLIEASQSGIVWSEPRDVTIEEVVDHVRKIDGGTEKDSCARDLLYITVSGEIRAVERGLSREELRETLLGKRLSEK